MLPRASNNDQLFREDFESGKVSPAQFNHRGHLRLTYTILCDNNVECAYRKVKDSIQSFLTLNGVDPGKYHETMTMAWVQAVRHFMEIVGATRSFDEFIAADNRLLDTNIMLTHYSRKLLFSSSAREVYLPPDLQPIPLY